MSRLLRPPVAPPPRKPDDSALVVAVAAARDLEAKVRRLSDENARLQQLQSELVAAILPFSEKAKLYEFKDGEALAIPHSSSDYRKLIDVVTRFRNR